MIWQGWVFIGIVAFIATYVTLTTSQDDVGIMFGLVGMLSWGLFAFQSLNVVILAGGKTDPVSYSYAAVSVWGLALAVTNLYVVLNGPIAIIDQRGRAGAEVTD